MKNLLYRIKLVFSIFCLSFILFSCKKDNRQEADLTEIAIFVPGIVSGNPVYEMLVRGVEKACEEFKANSTVIEAGTNQAEWNGKITALAASNKYDLIISSNPSLPDLIVPLTQKFPNTKYIILDAFCESNSNIASIRYNQREQAFFAGLVAGLVTTSTDSSLKYVNPAKKLGLIAAQEYPVMNDVIFPAFVEGSKFVDPEIEAEFRVVGSWADATKAAELANSLYSEGVDVILPIAGAGVQGVVTAAKEKGFYITWFDENGYDKLPGYVVSSTTIAQEKAAYEITKDFLTDKLVFGTAKTFGIKDGYVNFVFDDEVFTQTVPKSIQEQIKTVYSKIISGEYEFPYSN